MPPRNGRGRAKSLTGARGARGARGTCRNLDEGDDHQESVMGGRASAPIENVENVGGTLPTVLGGAEFMQGVFTVIEQVMRNTMQTMQVPVRMVESKATTSMKAFLQLHPPTFKGETDPSVAENWLEQVTRALDTILTVEEVGAKKWELFKKAFLDQYFTNTAKEALRMEFINLVQGKEEKAKQFMRGLRPSIRNKIAENLIKVYSTMVSSAAAIEETLNETKKIQNPKSQREGTGNQFEGRSFKKLKNSTAQQQYPTRSLPATSVVSSGQTYRGGPIYFGCHQLVKGPSGIAGQQEQQLDTSIVRGTLLMFNSWARILIDTGASHSFIASSFALALGLKVEVLDSVLMLNTLVGGRTILRRICRSCEIEINDRRFVFDFIVLDMMSFDIILGMDWLIGYHATIDCVRHRVTFRTLEEDHFHFVGDRGGGFIPSSTNGCRQDELIFLLACLGDESSVVSMVLPSVVCEFSNIFPKDLTELPPHREIEFSIDLIPGITPISVPLYVLRR
ncbi:hypothetical protein Acr_00g0011220 [Actinidia rufa]|uniref:Retrotransposon gag domain-containing protein n=1 Tax=Actinidia rufa TaxID=165716 RepID=A0A7J0DAU4_9ERIC|nr:hypothetical protein Acr_00g0011220 [Actinidia rufa]